MMNKVDKYVKSMFANIDTIRGNASESELVFFYNGVMFKVVQDKCILYISTAPDIKKKGYSTIRELYCVSIIDHHNLYITDQITRETLFEAERYTDYIKVHEAIEDNLLDFLKYISKILSIYKDTSIDSKSNSIEKRANKFISYFKKK